MLRKNMCRKLVSATLLSKFKFSSKNLIFDRIVICVEEKIVPGCWTNCPGTARKHKMNRPRHRKHGLSLIELMVAVAISAIMAVIAIPAFGQYLVKSNRTAAQAHLLDLAQGQQQYLLDNRTYAATLTDLAIATPVAVASRYTIALQVVAGPPPAFIITATPVVGSAQQGDPALTIDNASSRTPAALW